VEIHVLNFLARLFPNGNLPGRVPVLAVAMGLGVLFITGGFAVRAQQDQAVEVAWAGTSTALAPTLTPSVTPTETLTPTASNTATPTDTPTVTPTGTRPPTNTPAPTDTPSPTPVPASTVGLAMPTWDGTSTITAPTPATQVDVPDSVENILLLGSDIRPSDPGFRTDTIMVVSINHKEGTVNMLSIPRDMFVYAPGWGIVKINTVYQHGQGDGSQGGGPGLLKQTLLYNFGIVIHHYALIDLSNFTTIVDTIGGVDVAVECNYTGFRLKPPQLGPDDFDTYEAYVDYTDPEVSPGNWEVYTLPIGIHHFNGYMALWYGRFRHGSTDFERANRQQQVLRAILSQARNEGMVNVIRIPELWNQYNDLVKTDMGLGNMLEFVPIATDVETNEISSYNLADLGLVGYTPPNGPGAAHGQGYIIDPNNSEAAIQYITAAMGPPAQTVIQRISPVEIRNGTSHEGLDQIAGEQLGIQYNMFTIPTGASSEGLIAKTVIYDYTGQRKSAQVVQMQHQLGVAEAQVIAQPDPNRTVDYVVILGEDYYNKLNQCARVDPGTKNPLPGVTPTAAP
jgi:polyisoprenyl-teichoic acid--peptidoglycan teichoic acid transferase